MSTKKNVQYATRKQILEAEVVEVSDRDVVKFNNKFPFFKHNLDLQEQRLVFLVIAQIRMEDEDFKDYKVHLKDIEEKAGALQSSREVNKFARNLMSKTFTIEENDSYVTLSWFSSIRKIKGEQAIIVRCDPALKPYLLQLQKNFTKALLSILLKFKHKYTSQLYMLLKSRISKKLDMKVEELANILNVPQSYRKNFTDFWKRVLKPALDEIDKVSDLHIEKVEKIKMKYARKIESIKIVAKSKTAKKIDKDNDEKLIENANKTLIGKIIKVEGKEHKITNIQQEDKNFYIYATPIDEQGFAITTETIKIKVDRDYLKNFATFQDPIIIVDEGEIPLSKDMQEKADRLGNFAAQQVEKRLLSQK